MTQQKIKHLQHTIPDGTWYLTNLDGSFAEFKNGDIICNSEIKEVEPFKEIIKHHNHYMNYDTNTKT